MKQIVILATFIVTILLIGCKEIKEEKSSILHEKAIIEDVVYVPSKHETELKPSLAGSGAIGFGPGGIGLRIGGGLQITDVTVPEKFAIVFRCKHGQFIVEKQDVYEKLKNDKGKTVNVTYLEIYRATYEKKDGKKKLISRVLTDYDFLNAEVIKTME